MKLLNKIIGKISFSVRYWNYKRKINRSIANGLKIGKNVTIMPGAYIDDDYSFLISIGNNCSLSNGVLILAHDATTFRFTGGYTRVAKVDIKDNVFIGSNVTILPGVTIGPNVLIAAGSLINKDIPPNSCVAGVPARTYAKFDDFIDNHKNFIDSAFCFNVGDFDSSNQELKNKIKKNVENGHVYVKGYDGKNPFVLNDSILH